MQITISDTAALTIYNRALDLYSEPRADTLREAVARVTSAQGRIDTTLRYIPFATAMAEYLDLLGPWHEDAGEHAGISGIAIQL